MVYKEKNMNNSYSPKSGFNLKRGEWYLWIVRIMAFIAAPVLWWVSYTFSVKGFAFFLPEWVWVGQIFGVIFTILELMFNRGVAKHPTLFYAGIFAYIYSIGTNILGLFSASDLSIVHGPMLVLSGLMLIICAFGLDILPESMLVWSLFPNEPIITGDFVSNLLGGVQPLVQNVVQRTNVPNIRSNRPNNGFRQPLDASLEDSLLDKLDSQDSLDKVDSLGQPDSWVNSGVARSIRGYVHSHSAKGETPSVRQVAEAIHKPVSSVGLIMKKMRERGEIR
jgi:hypothetical protein